MTPVKGVVELSSMEIEAKWFRAIKKIASTSNVRIETEIIMEKKSVVSDIIEYSKKQSINLIVIGTKGKTGLRRLLLGKLHTCNTLRHKIPFNLISLVIF